ncbi:hypothetical protein ACWCWD_28930 [Streptomyces sp. NPDC001493]
MDALVCAGIGVAAPGPAAASPARTAADAQYAQYAHGAAIGWYRSPP